MPTNNDVKEAGFGCTCGAINCQGRFDEAIRGTVEPRNQNALLNLHNRIVAEAADEAGHAACQQCDDVVHRVLVEEERTRVWQLALSAVPEIKTPTEKTCSDEECLQYCFGEKQGCELTKAAIIAKAAADGVTIE